MKRLLMALSFTLLAGVSFANPPYPLPQLVYQTAISSMTTNIVTVSTSPNLGATQVDNPQLTGRVSIEIDNIDGSANLWCVPVSSGSLTANTATGRKILPGTAWVVSIAANVLNQGAASTTSASFWCLSDGTNPTKAAVSQAY